MKYEAKNIRRESIEPFLLELIDRCGSPESAAQAAGIGTSTMYRMVHQYNETVQMATARKILDALLERRRFDRKNGKTSDRYHNLRKLQAQHEHRLLELEGY